MALQEFIQWMKDLWFVWALLLIVVIVLSLLQIGAGYVGCHARWDASHKIVKYSPLGGCRVEHPIGSGKLIPEESIRILEEPVDQKKDKE